MRIWWCSMSFGQVHRSYWNCHSSLRGFKLLQNLLLPLRSSPPACRVDPYCPPGKPQHLCPPSTEVMPVLLQDSHRKCWPAQPACLKQRDEAWALKDLRSGWMLVVWSIFENLPHVHTQGFRMSMPCKGALFAQSVRMVNHISTSMTPP